MLIKSDISLQPVTISRDHELATYNPSPPVYLISYASGHDVFFKNQATLSYSALNKGIDHIFQFRRNHIDPVFYEKNKATLEIKSGGGYWLWKPYFIAKMLNEIPENSILIYADSAVIFYKPITKILDLLKEHDIILLQDGCPRKGYGTIGQKTKRELLQFLEMDTPDIRQRPGNWACLFIFKNTPNARKFADRWLELSQNLKILSPAMIDFKIQHPELICHGADQSIAGLVAEQMKEKVYYIHSDMLRELGIQNVHRHPNRQYISTLPYIFRIFKINEWFYNSKIIQTIRSWFYEN
ncbi:MAG: hypothetical protein J0H12_06960 [Candidatus Paracaedimonas acanthamoebae]|uniref:Uncharacterized protein n=1 Tax=Candidatus Paracaedimonas acanthamoebae TaxID=244581 RepID=A0A8J7PKT1_9PROT|nr:hypothetical protein [Candidatus Paracaedimonas acanthamoebae]